MATTSKPVSLLSKPVPLTLSKLNAHERDKNIIFDEGPHIYTVFGQLGYTSVTTWVHHHFDVFDGPGIVTGIMNSKKMQDPTYKYYGKTREEILDGWRKNGDSASSAGTQMHYDIECYYNGLPVENDSIEYSYFKKFEADFPSLKPYRTEWIVYYDELKLSGSIDMVFRDEITGKFYIYDWKRCNEIPHENAFGKMSKSPCLQHMPDAKYWHYSLQLNTYRRFLEDKYDIPIEGMFLVRLHPDNAYKTYERIEVQRLDAEMDALFAIRKEEAKTIILEDA
jgi:hypothetical protein